VKLSIEIHLRFRRTVNFVPRVEHGPSARDPLHGFLHFSQQYPHVVASYRTFFSATVTVKEPGVRSVTAL
jgi:hypothetical protein